MQTNDMCIYARKNVWSVKRALRQNMQPVQGLIFDQSASSTLSEQLL